MKPPQPHPQPIRLSISSLTVAILLAATPGRAVAEPTAAATIAFNSYIRSLEEKLDQQHRSGLGFVHGVDAVGSAAQTHLRGGEIVIEPLTPSNVRDLPGAMLHHWRATAFIPGAHAADVERLLRDVSGYPKVFTPQVLQAHELSQNPNSLQATMRVRQQHILTVVLDSTYDVTFGNLDTQHGYSLSRSTHIAEIASPGTSAERVLNAAQEHGFLWRQNTYWSYAERDGGVYVQVESVSLSRAIPLGLAWAVRPFIQSVPRESLEFTLRSVVNALHN